MSKNRFNIAVIPGDGIGKEVMPEGLRVLQAVMNRFDINLHFDHFEFASYRLKVRILDFHSKDVGSIPASLILLIITTIWMI